MGAAITRSMSPPAEPSSRPGGWPALGPRPSRLPRSGFVQDLLSAISNRRLRPCCSGPGAWKVWV